MARATTIAASAAALTAAGMVAFPLAGQGSIARRRIADVVVGGLAVATTAVARRWGIGRSLVAATAVAGGTVLAEVVGTTTGIPFGRYGYTGRLRPTFLGVPVVVPAAWWAMAVPAREAAHAALGRWSGPATRVGLGALALASWDLFLDPQMTGEDFWRWARRGRYRGIPLTNFAGWLVTGAVVMAALELLLPPGRPDLGLAGTYAAMGVMETLGFAAFFGDRAVAAIGGAAMLPVGVLGLVRALHA